ncbi:hypothetical protein CONPUDRAFT_147902 [Coniophora puteana RWD-64-598 SS2]|uniref:BAH domain-containing protein n=1 Tax=Coniophora puteana (strain RWD-64-598) TaxID=741705 RepID=R7SD75_CONPW|nr:uncharacterized protein CONPUDRAFT_147902 [Coniophora puteana RWD-64-598 SS2]EIW74126.1 hypothetical protein CONPUDRAFT_147902 [Coniophora puteana RWD-64-598 SS2]
MSYWYGKINDIHCYSRRSQSHEDVYVQVIWYYRRQDLPCSAADKQNRVFECMYPNELAFSDHMSPIHIDCIEEKVTIAEFKEKFLSALYIGPDVLYTRWTIGVTLKTQRSGDAILNSAALKASRDLQVHMRSGEQSLL